MGFFDILKKSNKKEQTQSVPRQNRVEEPSKAQFQYSRDGRYLMIDYYDNSTSFKQFYDTTRLIVDRMPTQIGNSQVHNCRISWYGSEDAEYLDSKMQAHTRKGQLKEIIAQIDPELLATDPNYCQSVIIGLLNESRVNRYLQAGLEENPQLPCGNYVGGVRQEGNRYGKFFDVQLGKLIHYSTAMQTKRSANRAQKEAAKARRRSDLQGQIDNLRDEMQGL